MRRAAVLVVLGLLPMVERAAAEPWRVTVEGGAEADSNVERVGSYADMSSQRIAAPVGRAGARIDVKDHALGGAYVLGVSGLARMVASARARPENVMLYVGEARWLRRLGEQPIASGVGVTASDALAIAGGVGARTFRNLGADALLALGTEDRHLTLAAGGRVFAYKPNRQFDWHGPVANARLDIVLWQTSGKTRSLELASSFGLEARSYDSKALANGCPPDARPSFRCPLGTSLPRFDRFQRVGLELNWTAEVIATAGYQLTVIDSNSYGQSLVRHRMMASATMELADKLFGTLSATVQIDQYPDGVLVEKDIQGQELTSLEDENRSSLQVRIARTLSGAWSLEARGAVWRDLGNRETSSFRRELIYAGLIYAR